MKKVFVYIIGAIAVLSLGLNLLAFKSINGKAGQSEKKNEYNEHIMVEIYEVPKYEDAGIHIHYGDGETEVIPFEGFKKEHHDENGEKILKAINKLEREGYDLTHVTSGVAHNGSITKIFMIKRK